MNADSYGPFLRFLDTSQFILVHIFGSSFIN